MKTPSPVHFRQIVPGFIVNSDSKTVISATQRAKRSGPVSGGCCVQVAWERPQVSERPPPARGLTFCNLPSRSFRPSSSVGAHSRGDIHWYCHAKTRRGSGALPQRKRLHVQPRQQHLQPWAQPESGHGDSTGNWCPRVLHELPHLSGASY